MVTKFQPSLETEYDSCTFQPVSTVRMHPSANGEWVKLKTFEDATKMHITMITRLQEKLKKKKSPEEMWAEFINLLEEKQPLGKDGDEVRHHVNFLGSIEKYRKIFMEANQE